MVLFSKDRILVPTDFSEKSLQALRDTIEFADTLSAVYVVHVLKPLEAVEPGVVWATVDNDKRRKTVQKLFDEKFPSHEYAGLNFSIEQGDPTSEIVDYAEWQNIDLIVMPSRGRTGISRFFMGSINLPCTTAIACFRPLKLIKPIRKVKKTAATNSHSTMKGNPFSPPILKN